MKVRERCLRWSWNSLDLEETRYELYRYGCACGNKMRLHINAEREIVCDDCEPLTRPYLVLKPGAKNIIEKPGYDREKVMAGGRCVRCGGKGEYAVKGECLCYDCLPYNLKCLFKSRILQKED